MITEIVTFQLPDGLSRDQLLNKYRVTAQKWRQNTDLIHKQSYYDEAKNLGGGVYLWKNIEAAKKWHGEDYRKMVLDTYGSEPTIHYFEGSLVVDNISGIVYERPPSV